MKNLKSTKGITLVALIITIIVLLILAMVSIRLVMNGGIIGRAEDGTQNYSIAEEKEQIQLGYKEYQMAKFQEANPTLKVEGATSVEGEGPWTITFPSGREYELETDGTITSDSETQAALANNPWGGAATESEVHPEYFNYEVITTANVDENGNQKLARLADTSGNIKIAETDTMGTIKITGINNAVLYSDIGGEPDQSDEENKPLYIAKAKERLARIVIPSTVKIKDGKYDATGTEYRVVGIKINKIDPYENIENGDKVNTEIILPNTITSIDDNAFCYTSLARITIPNSVTSIGDSAFVGCEKLASITIPNSVTSIGDSAFQNTSLTGVTIPNSVTSIGTYAFLSNQLTSVTIPNSVTSIGMSAFKCKINVVEDNSNYSSENGILFNKNKTQLLRYPVNNQEESYEIPSTVTSINQEAFSSAKLTSVTIPNSVTSIGEGAFLYWKESQTINIRAASKPSGWHYSWKGYYCNANIVWNYNGN